MIRFLRFLGAGSRRSLVLAICFGAASGLASAALIAFVSRIFTMSAGLEPTELAGAAATLVVAAAVVLGFDLFAKTLLVRHCVARHRDLHVGLLHSVLRDPLRKTERIGSARLVTIYTEDMFQIGAALNLAASVGISLFVVLGCLGYLVWIAPIGMLVVALVAVPAIWAYRRVHQRSVALAKVALVERDVHVAQFKSVVDGIKELKQSFAKRHDLVVDEFVPAVRAHQRALERSMIAFLLGRAWMQLAFIGLMIAALLAIVLPTGRTELLGPFLVVALFMRSHAMTLFATIPTWSRAGVILESLERDGYVDLEREWSLTPPRAPLHESGTPIEIAVSELRWTYRDEANDASFSVGPLDLSLRGGEVLFLVGHNGAGKTTLAKLICGLYESDSGTLSCNGTPIDDDNREAYRELFTSIFTDPFVFERLDVADSDLPDIAVASRIAGYLEKLRLHHKVRVENRRLESVALSHGQRKRLALLAAYLEDKPVLIFDEWGENQDPAFKEVFYRELLPELRAAGKAVVVITHESQYFDVADRLVTLEAPGDVSARVEPLAGAAA